MVPEAAVTAALAAPAVISGGADGFEPWYVREHPRVIAALTWVAGDPDIAADATDEAFARAYADWRSVGRMSSPGGWVYRVALNVVRRRMRRVATERRTGELPREVADIVDREIWTVVQQLPERQRVAVVLRYLLDLPEQEVAKIMGISRGTVASTLAAARGRLARWLAPEEVSDG
ncbi:MAG: sigma-70 family RNA polymerase sigma factor [Actinomycetota bacterium]|nr:sigma-70 family RNA polymerase sigma factor [Actinomycetota bacterium]